MTNKWPRIGAICLVFSLAACGSEDNGTGSDDAGTDITSNRDTGVAEDTGGTVEDTTPEPDVPVVEDTTPEPDVPVVEDTTPEPDTPIEPDVPGPALCGNNVRESGEICDGDDIIPGATCDSLGYLAGEVGCASDCTLDDSGCYDELCGDSQVTGTEECDGDLLNDATCESLGFAPGGEGVVACTDGCAYDTSTCEEFICGNDNVETDFEACDGEQFGDTTCRTEGFFDGTLSCNDDCSAVDTEGCVANVCGNGTVEGPEACDEGNIGASCRDFEVPGGGANYAGGVLACGEDCLDYDFTDCVELAEDLGDDTDDDGIPDADDNCPEIANPNQLDFDGNEVGNVCDEPTAWDIVVEEEGANVLATSIFADLGGATLPIPIPIPGLELPESIDIPVELVVETAEALVAFDDDGIATVVGLTLNFEDAEVEIDFGLDMSMFPIPIPGLGGGTATISDATLALGEEGDFELPGDLAAYLAGEIGGDVALIEAMFSATADTGSGAEPISNDSLEIADTATIISEFDGTYRWSWSDEEVVLGTTSVNLFIIDADLDVKGADVTVILGRAD